MSRSLLSRRARALVALACLSLMAIRSTAAGQDAAPVVIELTRTDAGLSCRIDSKLTDQTVTNNTLYVLNQIRSRRGSDVPVVVLVEKRVSLADIFNIERVAAKAQLNRLRFFAFDAADRSLMTELRWSGSVPFSRNPKAPLQP
jgi:hypothetical protein